MKKINCPPAAAYKRADGKKIDGRRVIVDIERGRTIKGWKPRRLGGGKGGRKSHFVEPLDERREDEDRHKPERHERERAGDRDRGERGDRDRERERERDRDRDRDRERKKSKEKGRSRSRSRDRSDRKKRSKSKGVYFLFCSEKSKKWQTNILC